tara:strand:- start:22002 stop:22406 length:405 start_codon:yes stop_codon:yes gene_type:complete
VNLPSLFQKLLNKLHIGPKLLDKLRIGPWLILALITTVGVGFLYPHQLGVLLWSLTKLCWGAYLGYWIDRTIFPYARPHAFAPSNDDPVAADTSYETDDAQIITGCSRLPFWELLMLRRALIIAAAILALGLGV